MPQLKLGLLPPRPDRPAMEFAELFPRGLPTPPPEWDATQGITDWGMLGNDQVGDCWVASYLHQSMVYQKIATGQVPSFTPDQAIGLYSQLSGYKPDVTGSDTGLNAEQCYALAAQRTLLGQRLQQFAPVRLRTNEHLQVATWLFDGLACGMLMPYNAQDLALAGKPWVFGSDEKSQPPQGGHAIPALKYDPEGVTFITWGQEQRAEWNWLAGAWEGADMTVLQTADILFPTEIANLQKALDNGYEPQALMAFLGTV